MTFLDTANLAADVDYQKRLAACVFTESLGKPDDPLADLILRNPSFYAASVFGAPVASSPGFGEAFATGGQAAVLDADLLAAVQANWDRLAGLYAPVTP